MIMRAGQLIDHSVFKGQHLMAYCFVAIRIMSNGESIDWDIVYGYHIRGHKDKTHI